MKKLERKAKSFMLTKEIPPGKVEVVRSILANTKLLEEERFRAIIDMLKDCPNKPHSEPRARKIDLNRSSPRSSQSPFTTTSPFFSGPSVGSENIGSLYHSYRALGLFRKRYLAASTNRFGITFKKRLIPSHKFISLFRDIRSFQDKIISRLSTIMDMILSDPAIDDPTGFNYLRIFHSWMMETPFASMSVERVKWLDQRNFESELRSWSSYFLSFRELDTSAKEGIILTIETKLRDMDELRKESILPFDNESVRVSKEKRNLEREKQIYEYMMILRSFLPSVDPSDGLVAKHLLTRFSIHSIEELIVITYCAIVFQRTISITDIIRFYTIKTPQISATEWDYSKEALRQYGKDPESKKRRYINLMKETLAEYNDLYEFINMRYETIDFVRKAFDDQWKIMNHRRHDSSDIYEKNFFGFIDDCMTHFLMVYSVFINGESIPLIDENNNTWNAPIFARSFFESELSSLFNLQSEIILYKTNNPNHLISHTEAKRLMMGQIPSMFDLESFIRQIGSTYYQLGRSLLRTIALHNTWKRTALENPSSQLTRVPLEKIDPLSKDTEIPLPIPFYDCRIALSEKFNAVQKMLVGRQIMSDSVKDGIIPAVTAFCLQFAHECFDRSIINDLEYRKDLIRKIEEAERF
ncbi:MAG TPA: hypothetical protein VF857_03245 [Spirochaetota bacterium]